ncbi:uncharacterized protein LOC114350030 [Ostrinia furnacalis]|uniref:uncharacterized protein LOC114350030 n=1 Tax=Ostrinia furnacalis TaxID=93504 RepID=UPI00103CF8E1|nr:uncharacterized protein LOC114350030 [Ostrinia furnacalis]
MDSLGSIVETQHALEQSLMKRMAEFEAHLQATKASSPAQSENLKSLSREFYTFREHTLGVVDLLRRQIQEVSRVVDGIEARHRSKFVLITGVPDVDNEDPLSATLTILKDNLGLPNIASASISTCHRLGRFKEGRSRPVILKFVSRETRSLVWKKKTQLKGTPFVISEFLTRTRQALFLNARKHFGMRRVWSMDGNVFIKLPNGARERVSSSEELDRLMERHSTVTPVPQESVPKRAGRTAEPAARVASADASIPKPGASKTQRACRSK